MPGFIQVTAEYSNAVFVALLPLFSDFAKKLELPVPTPLAPQQVARFVPYPFQGDVGGYLVITNGLELWYSHGRVEGFRTPRSYYNLQDPADIPRFYGTLKLNKSEGLALARRALRKAGYTLNESLADQEPQTEGPPCIGTNVVPHYRFTWDDPVFGARALWIEVDANRNTVQEMQLPSKLFWRAPPKIGVTPGPRSAAPTISVSVSNSYLETMLPKVSKFARALRLPVPATVKASDLKAVEFVDFDWVVTIILKNGYSFDCEKDHVAGFSAPDSAFMGRPRMPPMPLEAYLGRWRMNENEAVELARRAILALGCTPDAFGAAAKPEVTRRKPLGKYVVPRYFLRWVTTDSPGSEPRSYVSAEIDAHKKTLKHFYLLRIPSTENDGNPPPPNRKESSSSP